MVLMSSPEKGKKRLVTIFPTLCQSKSRQTMQKTVALKVGLKMPYRGYLGKLASNPTFSTFLTTDALIADAHVDGSFSTQFQKAFGPGLKLR